jgi:hypothetical protein
VGRVLQDGRVDRIVKERRGFTVRVGLPICMVMSKYKSVLNKSLCP